MKKTLPGLASCPSKKQKSLGIWINILMLEIQSLILPHISNSQMCSFKHSNSIFQPFAKSFFFIHGWVFFMNFFRSCNKVAMWLYHGCKGYTICYINANHLAYLHRIKLQLLCDPSIQLFSIFPKRKGDIDPPNELYKIFKAVLF